MYSVFTLLSSRYHFVPSLGIVIYRFALNESRLHVNFSTLHFNKHCLDFLQSRALLEQSFSMPIKNYLAHPNNIWESRCLTS